MGSIQERQTTDSKQGGEGTRPVGPGFNPGPMTADIGSPPTNTQAPLPPKDVGTK